MSSKVEVRSERVPSAAVPFLDNASSTILGFAVNFLSIAAHDKLKSHFVVVLWAMSVLVDGSYPRRYLALLWAFLFCLTVNAAGQVREQKSAPKSESKSPVKSTGTPSVDVSRWRSLLDQSKSGANSLSIDEGPRMRWLKLPMLTGLLIALCLKNGFRSR